MTVWSIVTHVEHCVRDVLQSKIVVLPKYWHRPGCESTLFYYIDTNVGRYRNVT